MTLRKLFKGNRKSSDADKTMRAESVRLRQERKDAAHYRMLRRLNKKKK